MSTPVTEPRSLAAQSKKIETKARQPLTRLARRGRNRWQRGCLSESRLRFMRSLSFSPFCTWSALSLVEWDGLGAMSFAGLENYVTVFRDQRFWLSIQHNLLWSAATLLGTTMLGLVLALLLARTHAWGRSIFQIIYFLPQMISSVVIAIMWRWIYYPTDGPLNVALGSVGLGFLQHTWLGESQTVLPATLYCLYLGRLWVCDVDVLDRY